MRFSLLSQPAVLISVLFLLTLSVPPACAQGPEDKSTGIPDPRSVRRPTNTVKAPPYEVY